MIAIFRFRFHERYVSVVSFADGTAEGISPSRVTTADARIAWCARCKRKLELANRGW